jgi:hypothetical protein
VADCEGGKGEAMDEPARHAFHHSNDRADFVEQTQKRREPFFEACFGQNLADLRSLRQPGEPGQETRPLFPV